MRKGRPDAFQAWVQRYHARPDQKKQSRIQSLLDTSRELYALPLREKRVLKMMHAAPEFQRIRSFLEEKARARELSFSEAADVFYHLFKIVNQALARECSRDKKLGAFMKRALTHDVASFEEIGLDVVPRDLSFSLVYGSGKRRIEFSIQSGNLQLFVFRN